MFMMNDLFWLTILLFIVAVALRSDLFFYLLYVVVGLQVLSRLWLRRSAGHLRWRRRTPSAAFPGERVTVELELNNDGLLPLPWLSISESLPPSMHSPPMISRGAVAGRRRAARADLHAGRPAARPSTGLGRSRSRPAMCWGWASAS